MVDMEGAALKCGVSVWVAGVICIASLTASWMISLSTPKWAAHRPPGDAPAIMVPVPT